jgi:beta-lactam-binding protein with PASTA domain
MRILALLCALPWSVAAQGPPSTPADPGSARAVDLRNVPDLTGVAIKAAHQILRLNDLSGAAGTFYIAPGNWREEIRPDSVGLQAPRGGARLAAGGPVGLWRFARAEVGQRVVETPDLRGRGRDRAIAELDQAGLRLLGPAETPGDPADAGATGALVVVDQYPHPGQPIYERTSVMIRLDPAPRQDGPDPPGPEAAPTPPPHQGAPRP